MLGKGPIHGEAQHSPFGAQVVKSILAIKTVAAHLEGRFGSDSVAGLEAVHLASHFFNRAGELVPDDDRELHSHFCVPVENM